jgi:hypothetical protein
VKCKPGGNTRRIFIQKLPRGAVPSVAAIFRIVMKFPETGSVAQKRKTPKIWANQKRNLILMLRRKPQEVVPFINVKSWEVKVHIPTKLLHLCLTQ